jgi:hypothetical protein
LIRKHASPGSIGLDIALNDMLGTFITPNTKNKKTCERKSKKIKKSMSKKVGGEQKYQNFLRRRRIEKNENEER